MAPVDQATAAPPATAGYQDASYDTAANQQPLYAPDPPPPLPEYDQPPCPGDNYFWTPGYWDYGTAGYYWVPGAWVIAPFVGALWTPPYWGFLDGRYALHSGYWGPHIGFYGGINYGFGYTGHGYYGAYWNNGAVYYNRSVTNVNVANIHNVYSYRAPAYSNTRVSYNGGRGGIDARPLAAEQAAARDRHAAPVPAQVQHIREAAGNRAQFASENRGKPQTLAAARPLPTSYKAPAARPPAEAARQAERAPAPENRAQLQPPPSRPGVENRAPENRPALQSRPVPEARPAAAPRPASRPAPEARPEARPAAAPRPAPAARPEAKPAAATRPAPKPAERKEER